MHMEATCLQENKPTVCSIIHVFHKYLSAHRAAASDYVTAMTHVWLNHTLNSCSKKKKFIFFLSLYSDSFTKQ